MARARARRYWRDSVAGTGAYATARDADDDIDADDGGTGRAGFSSMFRDGDGPNRKLLALLAAIVVAIVLIILLVNLIGGNDDNGGADPTETPLPNVINTDDSTEPARSSPDSRATEQPNERETPAPTDEVRRGGDNQVDQDNQDESTNEPTSTPEDSTGAQDQRALDAAPLGAVATTCTKTCLVRASVSADFVEVIRVAQVRPSFQRDSWAWIVAPRQSVAYLESRTPVALVADSAETVNLVVVTFPDKQADDSAVAKVGTVLDRQGQDVLLRVERIPARVNTLTDAGLTVAKFPPGLPPLDLAREQPPLSSVDIGSLGPEVSAQNIETTVMEMQGTSSTDGTNVGTRYYTEPGNAIAAEYLFQRLEAYGLTVAYEDFLTPDGYLLSNIIGELPGADASAIYGVMAHFDSTSVQISAAPGADDNATGVAASLEMARVLSGYKLSHPVHIIFTNAEEVGIIGSDVFARQAVADGIPYEGIFNIDSVGSDRQGARIILNADARSGWMSDVVVRVNDGYGYGQDIRALQTGSIVADDYKVRDQGIESIMVARELYGDSPVHHTTNDVIESVSIPNATSCTQLILISLAALVQN